MLRGLPRGRPPSHRPPKRAPSPLPQHKAHLLQVLPRKDSTCSQLPRWPQQLPLKLTLRQALKMLRAIKGHKTHKAPRELRVPRAPRGLLRLIKGQQWQHQVLKLIPRPVPNQVKLLNRFLQFRKRLFLWLRHHQGPRFLLRKLILRLVLKMLKALSPLRPPREARAVKVLQAQSPWLPLKRWLLRAQARVRLPQSLRQGLSAVESGQTWKLTWTDSPSSRLTTTTSTPTWLREWEMWKMSSCNKVSLPKVSYIRRPTTESTIRLL